MKQKELTETFMIISKLKQSFNVLGLYKIIQRFNPYKPEFTIVIFIHYKPRIAVAILDL